MLEEIIFVLFPRHNGVDDASDVKEAHQNGQTVVVRRRDINTQRKHRALPKFNHPNQEIICNEEVPQCDIVYQDIRPVNVADDLNYGDNPSRLVAEVNCR